jgi:hypothetical protein
MTDLQMDAYYYSFEPTGDDGVNLILSAVASAGSAFHHTDGWRDELEPYNKRFSGKCPADWIQGAANEAAANATTAQARIERLEAALRDIRDGRGMCGKCGEVASGEGAGVADCGCVYPVWEPRDPKLVAAATLKGETE